MRLLIAASNFPPVLGGIQTYAFELARALGKRCDQLLVVAPSAPGDREHDARSGLDIKRLPAAGDDLALSGIAPLAWLLRRREFDVALATHWSPAYALLQAAKLAGRKLPVFVAVHGKELLHRPLGRLPFAQSLYDRARDFAWSQAAGFFPVSRRTAQLLEDAYVAPSRITIVHNGVDPLHFRPRDASALRAQLTAGGPVLLSVARLVTRKGIDDVLRALPAVLQRHPATTYVILGDGPEYARLARLAAELGLTRNVCFLAEVTTDLTDYYNACDLFVMPAREEAADVEGFGLVFLEAGACEKPVIGARAGGAVDAIVDRETGLLVPPDDPATLSQAIIDLLDDPARRKQLGEAARARILREFTWDHAAAKMAARLTARD
ncbi:MAG TPA: glycosyltransferase family 4 protein [Polyangiales bacterium]|nr:glycosyltransferase family 4 protein [Polyangiales bacterium]